MDIPGTDNPYIVIIWILVSILVVLLATVAGPIFLEWYKKLFKKPKNHSEDLKNECHESVNIKTQINKIANHLEADRIWVAHLHNGGELMPTRKSIKRLTLFYEYLYPDHVDSLIGIIRDTPLAFFPHLLCDLYRSPEISIPEFNSKNKHWANFEKVIGDETKSLYIYGIGDRIKDFMGILVIEFIDKPKVLSEDDKTEINMGLRNIEKSMEKYLNI